MALQELSVDRVQVHSGMDFEERRPLLPNPNKLRSFDEALESPGVGFFHILLVLVSGWALASDSVEVQCVSFVTPLLNDGNANPDVRLRANDFQKGMLDAIIFLGMMVGGYFWGAWSDVFGRRSCLMTSLVFNGLFGFASAFSPNYYFFLAFRFMSGIGVGGSMPVTFSYFCEFFSKKTRGPFVIILAGFWILGSVFASLMALAIIEPLRDHIQTKMGFITLTSWRVYIMLCTFPALSAAALLLLLPESPSFLFDKGKSCRVTSALNRIGRWNSRCCYIYQPSRRQPLEVAEVEYISKLRTEYRETFLTKLISIVKATLKLFSIAYLKPTAVLCIVWFTFSFGYYGLLLWFPEYFKLTLQHHNSSDSNSNTSGNANISYSSIYLDSVYTSVAAIPATLLGILTVNLLGGKLMLMISLCLCALCTFIIRAVPTTEVNIVVLSCLFNGIAIFGWNALDIITTSEIYPVHLRSTAFGIQAAVGRVGSILGNLAFGKLINVDPMIPIIMVAALLLFGGVSMVFLPSPPGEGVLQNMRNVRRKCHMCLCWPVNKIVQIQHVKFK